MNTEQETIRLPSEYIGDNYYVSRLKSFLGRIELSTEQKEVIQSFAKSN